LNGGELEKREQHIGEYKTFRRQQLDDSASIHGGLDHIRENRTEVIVYSTRTSKVVGFAFPLCLSLETTTTAHHLSPRKPESASFLMKTVTTSQVDPGIDH